MNDNPKMVDLPWADGTTRVVPEWTRYESQDGYLSFAREGGYSYRSTTGNLPFDHDDNSAAVRIFTEAPEPPVKVEVPTSLGAIVSASIYPNEPCYVLIRDGWIGVRTGIKFDPSEIAEELSEGARVLFEGDDRKATPGPPLLE